MNQTSAAQTEQATKMKSVQHQYKPKTAFVHRDEIIKPGEFYFLKVDCHLFRGRVKPGEILIMLKGCLAEDGDIVQVVYDDPTVCGIDEYHSGVKYSAVCAGIIINTREDCQKRDIELCTS